MTGEGAKEGASSVPVSGVPYVPSSAQPVTEWSEAIFRELCDWASAHVGRWERWDPDYLVLTIDTHKGLAVEPVVIDTFEDELTVTFGYWETLLPEDGIHDDTDSRRAAVAARALASDWLEGRIATAVYFAGDKWCGSRMIEANEDYQSRIADIEWIKNLGPKRVELRWADRSRLTHFTLSNGHLVSP